jgi:hypothetical protein
MVSPQAFLLDAMKDLSLHVVPPETIVSDMFTGLAQQSELHRAAIMHASCRGAEMPLAIRRRLNAR